MDPLKTLIDHISGNPNAVMTGVLASVVICVFIYMLLQYFTALSDQLEANIVESLTEAHRPARLLGSRRPRVAARGWSRRS